MGSTLVLLMMVLTASSCFCGNTKDNLASDTLTSEEPAEIRFSLLIAGDLMQHMPQIKAARQSDGSYNYDECFAGIKDEVESADVAIANFETTLAGPPYSGFPQFSAPDDFLQATINAGFDVLLTANNHCVDTHKKGLERTLTMMDSLKVGHLGTYRNKEEREKNYPYLLEKDGLRIVLLNFTYGTNGLPVPEPCHVNLMDTTEIAADLEKAKEMNPDVIIALPHWGIEYQTLPSKAQKEMAGWLLEHGVDYIIGGHPHVAQPIELLNDRQTLIAWSLGNLVSNQSKPNTYGGYMVRLEFAKYDVVTVLFDHSYSLYWVSRPPDNGYRHNYRILPIDYPDSLLTTTEKNLRSAIRGSMRGLMKEHGKGEIKEKVL
jgi:poly-gamma-glutamate synthesis protein (capsule biosynthesis protein)